MKFKRKDKVAKDALQFISYLQYFQITDLLAFGKLLKVEEQDDFEEYLTDMVTKYTELPKREQKKFLTAAQSFAMRGEDFNTELRKKFREKSETKIKEEKTGE